MNTPTLSGVTLQTLQNYSSAATQAVTAYRLGSHRLVNAINGALTNSVYPRTAKLAPRVTTTLDGVRGNVSDVVVKGIDQMAQRSEQAIELGSTTAAAQLDKVARLAAGIDNALVANGLQAAARLALPGAQVALAVSGKLAEGATALADAAGARPVKTAVRKAATAVQRKSKPVVRQAKAAVKTATRATRDTSKTVRKAVRKTARQATAA